MDSFFYKRILGLESKEMLLVPEQPLPDGYDPTGRPWYMDMKTGELLGVIGVDIRAAEELRITASKLEELS